MTAIPNDAAAWLFAPAAGQPSTAPSMGDGAAAAEFLEVVVGLSPSPDLPAPVPEDTPEGKASAGQPSIEADPETPPEQTPLIAITDAEVPVLQPETARPPIDGAPLGTVVHAADEPPAALPEDTGKTHAQDRGDGPERPVIPVPTRPPYPGRDHPAVGIDRTAPPTTPGDPDIRVPRAETTAAVANAITPPKASQADIARGRRRQFAQPVAQATRETPDRSVNTRRVSTEPVVSVGELTVARDTAKQGEITLPKDKPSATAPMEDGLRPTEPAFRGANTPVSAEKTALTSVPDGIATGEEPLGQTASPTRSPDAAESQNRPVLRVSDLRAGIDREVRALAERTPVEVTHDGRPGQQKHTEIDLAPADLGRLKITLQTGERGLQLQITVERPESLEVVRRHLDGLHRDLISSGLSLDSFDLDTGLTDQSPRDEPAEEHGETGVPHMAEPEQATPASPRPASAPGRLDIRL